MRLLFQVFSVKDTTEDTGSVLPAILHTVSSMALQSTDLNDVRNFSTVLRIKMIGSTFVLSILELYIASKSSETGLKIELVETLNILLSKSQHNQRICCSSLEYRHNLYRILSYA